jgi:NitT/TauT family transport system permease protein
VKGLKSGMSALKLGARPASTRAADPEGGAARPAGGPAEPSARSPRRGRAGPGSRLSPGAEAIALRLAALVVILLLWWGVAAWFPLFVADPVSTVRTSYTWLTDGTISANIWVTLRELLYGSVLAIAVGIPAGIVLALSRALDTATRLYVDVFNALPRQGLAPLFVLWFGLGITSKVALVFSVLVFLIIVNTYSGVKSINPDYITLVRTLGANRRQVLMKVIFPSLTPWMITTLRLGSSMGLAAAVVGEFVAGNQGLGYLLSYQSQLLNKDGTFAALFVLSVIALIMTGLIMAIERHFLRWQRADRHPRRGRGRAVA